MSASSEPGPWIARSAPRALPSSTAAATLILFLGLVLFLTGCRTPPDMRPFADATSQLAGSIKTTGRTVASEIDSMSAEWSEDQRRRALDIAGKFTREWTQRNALADALLDYSASLAAIAQAGEQGEQSARAIAGSFKKLCDTMDVALPQAAAVEHVVKVGSYLYGKFAQDRAARTLGESMQRLQPAIDEAAVILGHSLQQIETGLDAIRDQNAQNIEDEILDEHEGRKRMVRTERNELRVLSRRRAALIEMLNSAGASRDKLRTDLLRSSDDAKQKEFERLAALSNDIASELAAVEASLAQGSERLAPINARQAADRERISVQITLVRTVRGGLTDWASAHSRLVSAALEKKPLQVDDLVQTALEIRDLVKTVRAERKE